MKKEPFLQVSKRRNKARWQERLLIRFIALILALIVCGAVIVALVKMNPVDVYKAIWDGAIGSPSVADHTRYNGTAVYFHWSGTCI